MLFASLVNELNKIYSMNGRANELSIKRCIRIGPFIKFKERPVLMELIDKNYIRFLLQHRKELPKGLYT